MYVGVDKNIESYILRTLRHIAEYNTGQRTEFKDVGLHCG